MPSLRICELPEHVFHPRSRHAELPRRIVPIVASPTQIVDPDQRETGVTHECTYLEEALAYTEMIHHLSCQKPWTALNLTMPPMIKTEVTMSIGWRSWQASWRPPTLMEAQTASP
jgi:hypothetical protein